MFLVFGLLFSLMGVVVLMQTNNDQSAFLGGFKEKEAFGESCVVYI